MHHMLDCSFTRCYEGKIASLFTPQWDERRTWYSGDDQGKIFVKYLSNQHKQ